MKITLSLILILFLLLACNSEKSDEVGAKGVSKVNLKSIMPKVVREDGKTVVIDVDDSTGGDTNNLKEKIHYSCKYEKAGQKGELDCSSLSNFNLDEESGKIEWRPSLDQGGNYKFKIMGFTSSASDTKTFDLTVKEVNRAPKVSFFSEHFDVKPKSKLIPFDLKAGAKTKNIDGKDVPIDQDGDPITYKCVYDRQIDREVKKNFPCQGLKNATFDKTQGKLDWTPNFAQFGDYEFQVTATDGKDEDTQIFTVTVEKTMPPNKHRAHLDDQVEGFGGQVALYENRAIVTFIGGFFSYILNDGQWIKEEKVMVADACYTQTDLKFLGDRVAFGGDNCVLVYKLAANGWELEQKLVSDDLEPKDRFGFSVSMYGDFIVVGAQSDIYPPHTSYYPGSVYIFKYENGKWNQLQKIVSQIINNREGFGGDVAISDEWLMICAYKYGRVYFYKLVDGLWQFDHKIDTPLYIHASGSSEIWGDVAAFGAWNYTPEGCTECGTIHMYRFKDSQWTFEQELVPSTRQTGAHFGRTVSLYGNKVIGGTYGQSIGTAYMYTFDGKTWGNEKRFSPDDYDPTARYHMVIRFGEGFAGTHALWGDNVIIGASGDRVYGETPSGAIYSYNVGAQQ